MLLLLSAWLNICGWLVLIHLKWKKIIQSTHISMCPVRIKTLVNSNQSIELNPFVFEHIIMKLSP